MKIVSQISSLIFRYAAIIIVGFISWYVGLLIFNYSLITVFLALIFICLLIFFVSYPRIFIYFIVISYPIMPMFYRSTGVRPEGVQYLSINAGGVMLVLGAAVGILVLLLDRVKVSKHELSVPLFLFLGMVMFCVIRSPLFLWAFRQWVRFAMPALFYLLVVEKIKDFNEAKKLLKLAVLFFIPAIIYSFLLLYVPSVRPPHDTEEMVLSSAYSVYRLAGPYGSRLGITLVIYSLFFLFFFFEYSRWKYLVLFLSMVFLLFQTYLRAGWAAFLGAMSIVGFLRSRSFYFVFLLVGIFILTLLPTATDMAKLRLFDEGPIKSRLKLYEIAWELIQQHPIIGNGQGAVSLTTGAKVHMHHKQALSYGVAGSMAHNEYLRFLVDGGIVMLSIYLYLIYRGLKLSYKIFRLPTTTAKNYGASLIAMIASILFYGTSDSGFESISFYFWFFIAIGEIYLRGFNAQSQQV